MKIDYSNAAHPVLHITIGKEQTIKQAAQEIEKRVKCSLPLTVTVQQMRLRIRQMGSSGHRWMESETGHTLAAILTCCQFTAWQRISLPLQLKSKARTISGTF
jgi:hypothetical protein